MTTPFIKATCLICFKKFEIPKNIDDTIYYERKEKVFGYYQSNLEVDKIMDRFFTSNPRLQQKNDDSKGNIARKFLATIADGNWEPVFRSCRCPRCNMKLYTYSYKSQNVHELKNLTFKESLTLYGSNQFDKLFINAKNGL